MATPSSRRRRTRIPTRPPSWRWPGSSRLASARTPAPRWPSWTRRPPPTWACRSTSAGWPWPSSRRTRSGLGRRSRTWSSCWPSATSSPPATIRAVHHGLAAAEGLLETLRFIRDLRPRVLIHGHTPLTELFTIEAINGLQAALTELHGVVLDAIRDGVALPAILDGNHLPDVLRGHPS